MEGFEMIRWLLARDPITVAYWVGFLVGGIVVFGATHSWPVAPAQMPSEVTVDAQTGAVVLLCHQDEICDCYGASNCTITRRK
jgi:hypothetical protein